VGPVPQEYPDDELKKSLVQAKLPVNIGFHDLRRYQASQWNYHDGLSVRELQVLLGYADVQTTMRYLASNGLGRACSGGSESQCRRAQNSWTRQDHSRTVAGQEFIVRVLQKELKTRNEM
jgi:hypothetical protein